MQKIHFIIKSFYILQIKIDSDENSSNFKVAIKNQEQVCQSIQNQMSKLTEFEQKLSIKIKESTDAIKDIQPDLEQIRKLQQLVQYLRIVQDIQDIR